MGKHFFVLSFIFVLLFSTPVYASTAVDATASSSSIGNVVKIVTSCVDEKNQSYLVSQGTGFLVGTPTSEQYIITDYQLVNPSADSISKIKKGVGLSSSTKLTTVISIYLSENIVITAAVHTSSEVSNYAILKPSVKIDTYEPFRLGDTSSLSRNDEVTVFGYQGDFSILGQDEIHGFEVTAENCFVSFLQHSPIALEISSSNSSSLIGSPITNDAGYVVGMITYEDKNSVTIVPIETLITVLDTFGIAYGNNALASDYNVATSEVINSLQTLLVECQLDVTMHEHLYATKSLTAYKAAINAASGVMSKETSTKDEYVTCINNLTKAKGDLKAKNYTLHIVQWVLLLVVVLLISLNIKQFLTGKQIQNTLNPAKPKQKKISKSEHLAALVRLDTNETVFLTKRGLRIGKNPKQADYCITDSNLVSRLHACIELKEQTFYLKDLHSTNKTCINNSFIEPDRWCQLYDEDSISIANVKFIFRYLKAL